MKECVLMSLQSGKIYKFNSVTKAATFLGRDYAYVQKLRRLKMRLRHKKTKEAFEIVTDTENICELVSAEEGMVYEGVPYNSQPCSFCDKAICGCEWSERFEPVPGWKAIPTVLDKGNGNRPINSYKILYCPKFAKG